MPPDPKAQTVDTGLAQARRSADSPLLPYDRPGDPFGGTHGRDEAPTGLPAAFTIADMKSKFGK